MATNPPVVYDSDLSDEEFAAKYKEPTPQQAASMGIPPSDLSDEQFSAMYPPPGAEVTAKPENQYNPPASLLEYYSSKWQAGEADVTRGILGSKAIRGEVTYDELKQDASLASLKQKQADLQAYEKTKFDGGWQTKIFGEKFNWDLRQWAGTAIQSLPFMREVWVGGAKGGAAGAALGAGGAFVAGQLGPQVATPEEVVTVPAAAGVGWTWGFRGGAFMASAHIMAGQTYMDFRDAGLTDDVAKPAAVASGIISGVIEAAQLSQLTNAGRKAFASQLATAEGKATLLKFVKDYAKEWFFQVTEEELQQITQLTSQAIAASISKNEGAMPTADEWKQQLIQTFIQSAQASAVMVGASEGAGHVSGMTVNSIRENVQAKENIVNAIKQTEAAQKGAEVIQQVTGRIAQGKMTVAQAMALIKDGFSNHKVSQENVDAGATMSTSDALDLLTKPLFDEKGNINPDTHQAIQEATQQVIDNVVAQFDGNRTLTAGIVNEAPAPQQFDVTDPSQGPTPDQVAAAESSAPIPDPVLDESLGGAPSIEVQGRINQVESDLNVVDKQISDFEDQFTQKDTVNTRADELKTKLDSLKNEHKINAAHIEQLNRDVAAKEKAGKPTDHINKTLDKIGENQQAVVDQMNRVKEELSTLKPSPTEGIVNQLERLYKKRAAMEEDLAMLKNGVYEAQDLKGLDIKVKADKVLALRAKAAHEVIKNFRRGVREGMSYTKDQIKTVQNQLISLIKTSGMTPEDQAKFISRIKNIQTQDQLIKALRGHEVKETMKVPTGELDANGKPKYKRVQTGATHWEPGIEQRIKDLIEAQAKRDALASLDRTLARTELRKGGKRPVGKYTADIQRILDLYRDLIQDPEKRHAALQDGMNDMVSDIRDSENLGDASGTLKSGKAQLAKFVAQRIGDLNRIAIDKNGRVSIVQGSKTSEQINDLNAEILHIIETGKEAILTKKMAEADARIEMVNKALLSIDGNKPPDAREIVNSEMRLNTWKNNSFTRLMKTLGRTINSWDGLMRILSQNDQDNALADIADVHQAIRREYSDTKKYKTKVFDTVIEKAGAKKAKVLDRMVSGSIRKKVDTYVNLDGKSVPLVITRNEAIKLWMQFHDTDLGSGLREGNRYTKPEDVAPGEKSTFTVLEEYLTPEDKKMAEGLQQFYREYFDRVNAEWEDEAGASLKRNDTYSGYAKRSGTTESATQEFFNEQFSRSSIKPDSTMFRTDNKLPLELSDAFVDAIKHVHDFEHWIAWRKVDKNIRSIFRNRAVRNTIKLKYGDGMMRTIDDRYHDMIGTRADQSGEALKFLDHMRRNAGTAYVGGKPLQFFKQYTAVVNFLLHVDAPNFVIGWLDFARNPVKAIKTLEQSPMLKERVDTWDRDWMEAMQNDSIKSFKGKPTLIQMMQWYVKYGDRATIWSGGWSVYRAVLKKTGSPEQAMIAFEKAFNSTQSSGTIDQLSQLERSGPAGKMFTIFLKQNLQMIEAEMGSIRKALALPSLENTYKAIRTIAVVHTANVLFQAVSSIPVFLFGDDPEKEDEMFKLLRAAITGPFNGLPIMGDLITAASTQVTNWVFDRKEMIWKPQFLPYAAGGKLLDLMKHVYHSMDDGQVDAEEFFKMFHDYARSVDLLMPSQIGGLPKEPAANFFEWLFTAPAD